MIYVIEENIPLPQRGTQTELRETLSALEVGDSFMIPDGDKALRRVQRAAGRIKVSSLHGWDYTTRREGNSYRIWRTK